MGPHLEFSTPAPSCPLPCAHPSRAHVPSGHTDVLRTWREHDVSNLDKEYDDDDARPGSGLD